LRVGPFISARRYSYGAGWRKQAERIAWRICKTWLEAQITLINLEQAKLEEVFLPYLVMAGDKQCRVKTALDVSSPMRLIWDMDGSGVGY
jgi:hypothetical protein